jgi:immune inhibitor A
MSNRVRLAFILAFLMLLGLACNTITGNPTPVPPTSQPATAAAEPPDNSPTTSSPAASPTNVPPQTRTPGPEAGGGVTESSPPPNWPAPIAPLSSLARTSVSDEQQAVFDLLSAAAPPERDDLELARAYQGWSGALATPIAVTEPQAVGTIETLNVLNTDTNTIGPIEAELLAVSGYAYFWFDTGPGSRRPTADQLAEVGAAFDEIYENSVAIFGQENSPGVDGDPRIHIVNASPLAVCDVSLATAASCGLAGYFSAFDSLPKDVDPSSNAREMFVMNVDYFGSDFYLNVLAHEFRHMIEDNYDQGDADWAVEGSAMLAEELLGFHGNGVYRANIFLEQPDQQLNAWTDGYSIPYYGQGYLFNRFIYDRLGQALYQEFASSPDSGLVAIDTVAAGAGLDLTGETLWLDWLVAMAIHDRPGVTEQYQFQTSGLNTARMQAVDRLPAVFEESVAQYAVDYYRLSGDEPISLSFTGSSHVPLIDTVSASGQYMWLSNRANYSHMRLTRPIDLRQVQQATLEYSVYHDIELGYDFGYLFVSTDGGHSWQSLAGDQMQGRSAEDNPSGKAMSDRFYTGRSERWLQERIDLTRFAGQEILLRFAYITDPILTFGGLALDNIAIPEIGFYDDAETLTGGWLAEGFDRVTAYVPQQWHLQLITFSGGIPQVTRLALAADQTVVYELSLAESGREAILVVAASAPMTLERAHYRLEFDD